MKLSLITILAIGTGLASASVINPLEARNVLARDCEEQNCSACEAEAAQSGICNEAWCCGCALC